MLDYNHEVIVYINVSSVGMGAILCQADDRGSLHPMTLISKRFQPGERHLSAIKRACLSVVWMLQRLKPYIWGRKFILCTNHFPLVWLQTMKSTNSKLARWTRNLQDFDFVICSVKGIQSVDADALSRRLNF